MRVYVDDTHIYYIWFKKSKNRAEQNQNARTSRRCCSKYSNIQQQRTQYIHKSPIFNVCVFVNVFFFSILWFYDNSWDRTFINTRPIMSNEVSEYIFFVSFTLIVFIFIILKAFQKKINNNTNTKAHKSCCSFFIYYQVLAIFDNSISLSKKVGL